MTKITGHTNLETKHPNTKTKNLVTNSTTKGTTKGKIDNKVIPTKISLQRTAKVNTNKFVKNQTTTVVAHVTFFNFMKALIPNSTEKV